jgi:hypothetical protein
MQRIVFLLVVAAYVRADVVPITFTFTGNVDNDPFGAFGAATFSGGYTFDANTPQVLNTPQSGGYAGQGGIFAMDVVFTGTNGGALDGVPFAADTLNITVNNDFPGPLDQYLVTGMSSVDSALTIELALNDFTGTAVSNTSLPLVPPNLANFASVRFALFAGTLDNPIEVEGSIGSLTCTSGCGATPVPEPAYAPLLGVGVGALIWFGRRKARSRVQDSPNARVA